MSLSVFIRQEIDCIVDSWEEFARTRLPPAQAMSSQQLQDHARSLLLAIAEDIEADQSGSDQQAKSRGELPENAPAVTQAAHDHAQHRFTEGFSLNAMVAEYRALRASVQRLWAERWPEDSQSAALQLARFNEAMDQGLTESIAWYSRRLDESRELLLAVLGHDLRNPLGAILGSGRLLTLGGPLDSRQSQAVNRILNSAQRMQGMVDVLLDFTRTRLGQGLSVARAPGDLADLCQSVIEELQAFHPDSHLRLHCAGDLHGNWDLPRIGQLLSNLVSNAIQHGAPRQPVTIHASGLDDAVLIAVHNEGPPIPEPVRQQLFEPLKRQTSASVGRRGGSSGLGLGLYIAHEIAVAHGGSLTVDSSERDGTTFQICLPVGSVSGNCASAAACSPAREAPDGGK